MGREATMKTSADFWQGKRVCVTGGTGFLGYHIVRLLLDQGARVTVLALAAPEDHPIHQDRGVEFVVGDVRDAAAMRRATDSCCVVFHTAGMVNARSSVRDQMISSHREGTEVALSVAPSAAIFVHTSSIVTLGASQTQEVLNEESEFRLANVRFHYMEAKRASEELALSAAARGRHVVVTNPGYLLGPMDFGRSVMGRFCERCWKGRIPFTTPGGFNLVDVRDVAEGHLLAAERGASGRRYIMGGENHTLREFMARLATCAGLRPRVLPHMPITALKAIAGFAELRGWLFNKDAYPSWQHAQLSSYYWYVDSSRAARELGYRSRPLQECLQDAYEWYANRGSMVLRGINRWWMRPQDSRRSAA
jgi:dihydroflavonol-4-reductase